MSPEGETWWASGLGGKVSVQQMYPAVKTSSLREQELTNAALCLLQRDFEGLQCSGSLHFWSGAQSCQGPTVSLKCPSGEEGRVPLHKSRKCTSVLCRHRLLTEQSLCSAVIINITPRTRQSPCSCIAKQSSPLERLEHSSQRRGLYKTQGLIRW